MKKEIISILETLSPSFQNAMKNEQYLWSDEGKSLLAKLHSFYREVKNLLIVRLDAIGDNLLFLNSLKQISLLFPNAKITYVCYSEIKEIIDRCEFIDVPVFIDRALLKNDAAYRERIYITLQGYHFDLLINPLFSREFLAEEIIYFINANLKIGFSCDTSNINPVLLNVTNKWYDCILQADKEHNKFELYRNAELVNLLGGNSRPTDLPKLKICKEDVDFILHFISQYELKDYAVIFPGTKDGKKSIKYWDSEKYAQLTDYIQLNSSLKVIILGGPDEDDICNEITGLCRTRPLKFQGHSIGKSKELLRSSKFYVGSDTSMAHFSAALEIPTIVLLGGGHFGRFFPYPDHHHVSSVYKKMNCYYCNWICTQSTNKCIKEISVNDIKEVLNKLSLLTEYNIVSKEKQNESNHKITIENFTDFTYSKHSHFKYFTHREIHPDTDFMRSDLKVYQDLLVYNFILENIPAGSRILEIGGGNSRIINALHSKYEFWNLDKLEGLGNGPAFFGYNSNGHKLVRDYIGSFNKELPENYFDCVFSISALEHVPENEENFSNICEDINRVLKTNGLSVHCFDVIKKPSSFWSNKLLQFIFSSVNVINPFVPFYKIANEDDLYTMSKAAYDEIWKPITNVSYESFGSPLSYNVLWKKIGTEVSV